MYLYHVLVCFSAWLQCVFYYHGPKTMDAKGEANKTEISPGHIYLNIILTKQQ